MKVIRTLIVTTGLTAGATYLAYRLLLKEDARKRVDKAVESLRNSYLRVNEIVEGVTGIIMEEPAPDLPNRIATIKQWEELGYGDA